MPWVGIPRAAVSSTPPTWSMSYRWQAGLLELGRIATQPATTRQANQAGFYGAGNIWSVGGLNGATFVFVAEVHIIQTARSFTISTTMLGPRTPCPRRSLISQPSAPIWLTTLLSPRVGLGLCSRSMPMGYTSTARDRRRVSMPSSTTIARPFPARRSIQP